jgi:hypothetical protein
MQYVAWLIDEAWDHRRRRLLRLAVGVMAGLVAVIASLAFSRGGEFTLGGSPPPITVLAPSRALSQPPYMGVTCPIANSIGCDRIGLAVWLKQPAVSITATIAGSPPFALDWFGDERRLSQQRPHRDFDGYLQPAGIVSRLHVQPVEGTEVLTGHGRTILINSPQMWFGEGSPPPALVNLTIHYADGRTVFTKVRVDLATGWG